MYPKALSDLMQDLQRFPGVGAKSAERFAFEMLEWDDEAIETFATHLVQLKAGVHRCEICNNFAEGNICDICADASRDHSIVCVVSFPKDIIAIERSQQYQGVYHVLNGVISPNKGIFPDDLHIDDLVLRIQAGTIAEVILAISPTMEGETTALYLSKLLSGYDITITRIAHGLPMGGQLDYADELTIFKAFEGRVKIDK